MVEWCRGVDEARKAKGRGQGPGGSVQSAQDASQATHHERPQGVREAEPLREVGHGQDCHEDDGEEGLVRLYHRVFKCGVCDG